MKAEGIGVRLERIEVERDVAIGRKLGLGGTVLPALLFLLLTLPFTLPIALNLLGLAVLCSAVAYVLYYRLIADVGPTRALTVTFLVPGFGMLWGVLFLGESIRVPMLLGFALIVTGVLAVGGTLQTLLSPRRA